MAELAHELGGPANRKNTEIRDLIPARPRPEPKQPARSDQVGETEHRANRSDNEPFETEVRWLMTFLLLVVRLRAVWGPTGLANCRRLGPRRRHSAGRRLPCAASDRDQFAVWMYNEMDL
jgi:hypothetical protein